jgi:hypothetical protein
MALIYTVDTAASFTLRAKGLNGVEVGIYPLGTSLMVQIVFCKDEKWVDVPRGITSSAQIKNKAIVYDKQQPMQVYYHGKLLFSTKPHVQYNTSI